MAHYTLSTPVSETDIRKLRINDTVTLQNTLFGIRDATQIQMFDHDRKTRFDLKAAAPESVASLILSSCPGSIQHIEVYLVMKVNSRRYQILGS